MSRRKAHFPDWLWFFLALPLGVLVMLIYQRKRIAPGLRALKQRLPDLPILNRPRYREPDSIPIDIRPPLEEMDPLAGESLEATGDEALLEEEIVVIAPEPVMPAGVYGDDLKIIEGIGPAIARLLAESGITTFRQLADTPLEQLDEILTSARLRRLADPGTWAEQARLAANGEWATLSELQASLKGGRRRAAG